MALNKHKVEVTHEKLRWRGFDSKDILNALIWTTLNLFYPAKSTNNCALNTRFTQRTFQHLWLPQVNVQAKVIEGQRRAQTFLESCWRIERQAPSVFQPISTVRDLRTLTHYRRLPIHTLSSDTAVYGVDCSSNVSVLVTQQECHQFRNLNWLGDSAKGDISTVGFLEVWTTNGGIIRGYCIQHWRINPTAE